MDDQPSHLEQIDAWLATFGIDHADIGILIGPEWVESQNAIQISYSIRVTDGDYPGRHEIDGSYTFSDTDAETVLTDIYPAIVDEFEQRFHNADIHSYRYEP